MTDSISFYRRHRPGSFDEVVGQQHVVRTLRNAVEQGKVHHAYLFVGSRGTGKTSMAKILARSLNCERGGPTITPCGECESCLTIAGGTSIDVIEMDAASNRSVDDVRDLRERVAYAPTGGRWKVYILDEAHMLTKEAWNAFLKTLEEPPPNTVFVLATTESHKVMATIADRCQRFDFQRPSLEQISEVLTRVSAAEGIEAEDAAVAMIARSASGSFRDALGTLDQLVAFGGSQVKLDDVLELLGAADAELLFDAVDAVIGQDPKAVLLGVEKMARSGRDPSQFARDLLAHLRHLLVAQTVGEVPNTFVVTATDADRLAAQANAIGAATLVRTIDELANALTAVREGDDARMAVEIALLKAARPDLDPSTEGLLRRIERLEQGTGAVGPRVLSQGEGGTAGSPRAVLDPPPPAPPPADTAPVDDAAHEPPQASPQDSEASTEDPVASASEADDSLEVAKAEISEPAEPVPSAADDPPGGGAGVGGSSAARRPVFRPDDAQSEDDSSGEKPSAELDPPTPATGPAGQIDLDEIVRVWPAVIHKLGETSPALAATFDGARPVSMDDEGLKVGFPAEFTFNKRKAEAPEKRELIADAIESVLGERIKPTYVLLDGDVASDDDDEETSEGEIDHDALVEKLKSEFDAKEVG
ncbi:MAG TPA: DNA polymerase III subunit gamma/tau [Solirubrobacterales bacterium]|nr:DNA polymerase III subunit gamma/tau [Solirubrobacterales bacterium]